MYMDNERVDYEQLLADIFRVFVLSKQVINANNLIIKSPILEGIDEHVSTYAHQFTVLNMVSALSWKVSSKPSYFKVSQENEEHSVKVYNKNHTSSCNCYLACNMKMPCEHVLACLIYSIDIVHE